jgi:hypothetical protein
MEKKILLRGAAMAIMEINRLASIRIAIVDHAVNQIITVPT